MKSLPRTRLLGIFCAELRANSIVCRTALLFSPKQSVIGVTSPRELGSASRISFVMRSLHATPSQPIFCRESSRKPFVFKMAGYFSSEQWVIGITRRCEPGAPQSPFLISALPSTSSRPIFCGESSRKPFVFKMARFFSLKDSVMGVTSRCVPGARLPARPSLSRMSRAGASPCDLWDRSHFPA